MRYLPYIIIINPFIKLNKISLIVSFEMTYSIEIIRKSGLERHDGQIEQNKSRTGRFVGIVCLVIKGGNTL